MESPQRLRGRSTLLGSSSQMLHVSPINVEAQLEVSFTIPMRTACKFCGENVPREIMDDLLAASQNPIHELELLPVLVASMLWGELFTGAQVVFYIDNESARMAYIRGGGETLRGAHIIQAFVERESELQQAETPTNASGLMEF